MLLLSLRSICTTDVLQSSGHTRCCVAACVFVTLGFVSFYCNPHQRSMVAGMSIGSSVSGGVKDVVYERNVMTEQAGEWGQGAHIKTRIEYGGYIENIVFVNNVFKVAGNPGGTLVIETEYVAISRTAVSLPSLCRLSAVSLLSLCCLSDVFLVFL